MSKRLDAYIRISKLAGRGEMLRSDREQEDAIRRAAERKGFEIAEVNTLDLDKSGGTLERPGFQRVLQRIRDGEVDGVAVYDASRFARSVVIGATCAEEIVDKIGATFFSATEEMDLSSPYGRAMFNTLMTFSQLQRDMTKQRMALAQTDALDEGIFIGPTPTGYTRAKTNPRTGRPAGQLVPDPHETPIVRELFRLRADEGWSYSRLCRWLDERIPSKRGERWSIPGIRSLLRNDVYLGHTTFAGVTRENTHEPIIPGSLHRAAGAARGVYKKRDDTWLLSGFLRCASCRYRLIVNNKREFRCKTNYNQGATCAHPAAIAIEKIDRIVTDDVMARQHERIVMLGGDLDALESAKTEFEEAQDALQGAYAERSRAKRPELVTPIAEAAEARLEAAERALRDLQRRVNPDGPKVFTLASLWEDMDVSERRMAVAGYVAFAVVSPDRVRIVHADDDTGSLPRPGRGGGTLGPFDETLGHEPLAREAALENRA